MGRGPAIKWADENYVKAYELARSGASDTGIALALGVKQHTTWLRWLKERPALRNAVDTGRGMKEEKGSIEDELLDKLPEGTRVLWERMLKTEGLSEATAKARARKRKYQDEIEDEVEELPEKERQRLYLYALLHSNFIRSDACKKARVSAQLVRKWEENSPTFAKMALEMEQAKKDFFESALVSLVRQGDTHAIIFANRTVNRDRGYNDRVEVKVTGRVSHAVTLAALPVETRRQLLDALRSRGETPPSGLFLPAPKEIIDVTPVEAEKCTGPSNESLDIL